MLNCQHDPAPYGGSIDLLFAFLHGFDDVTCGFIRFDGKGSRSLRGFEHFRFHKAWLHCQHIHTVTREPVAQCFEISCKSALDVL